MTLNPAMQANLDQYVANQGQAYGMMPGHLSGLPSTSATPFNYGGGGGGGGGEPRRDADQERPNQATDDRWVDPRPSGAAAILQQERQADARSQVAQILGGGGRSSGAVAKGCLTDAGLIDPVADLWRSPGAAGSTGGGGGHT